MGKNKRRRHEPQRPSAFKARPSPGRQLITETKKSPYERISLEEGFQRLLSVCSPHRAAGRLYTAGCEKECDIWLDGKLCDPNYIRSLTIEPWIAADGCWRLKIKKGVEAVNTDGSRSIVADKSAANWEASVAGIADVLADLQANAKQTAPAPAPLIKVELVGRPKVQLVEKPIPRAKAQSPSQPTEDQIRMLMGDVSGLSDLLKKIRRYAVLKYGTQWRDHNPADVRQKAKNDPLYQKEVGGIVHHITTFRRGLGRKK